MTYYPSLRPGQYYHIYNRANGSENLFREEANYIRFLELYDKYISPVADTLAWVLMANHFHFLVWIKEGMYYKYSKEDFSSSNADRSAPHKAGADAIGFEDVKWETIPDTSASANPSASAGPDGIGIGRKIPNPTKHFSHLFNAYAKYINDKYNRHGSLFQRPFKRKPVEDEDYLRRVVLYIHNNPVHHGFVSQLSGYPWSSYHVCLSSGPTKLQRKLVLDWFDGAENFKKAHRDYSDHAASEAWPEEDGEMQNEILKE